MGSFCLYETLNLYIFFTVFVLTLYLEDGLSIFPLPHVLSPDPPVFSSLATSLPPSSFHYSKCSPTAVLGGSADVRSIGTPSKI